MQIYHFYLDNAEKVFLKAKWGDAASGVWWSTVASGITEDEWFHVAVTYDATSPANNAIIYVNGTSSAVTETGTTPAGAYYGIVCSRWIYRKRFEVEITPS